MIFQNPSQVFEESWNILKDVWKKKAWGFSNSWKIVGNIERPLKTLRIFEEFDSETFAFGISDKSPLIPGVSAFEENWDKNKKLEEFTKAMHAAAQSHLTEISPEQKNNYISKETWNLIKERQTQRRRRICNK